MSLIGINSDIFRHSVQLTRLVVGLLLPMRNSLTINDISSMNYRQNGATNLACAAADSTVFATTPLNTEKSVISSGLFSLRNVTFWWLR